MFVDSLTGILKLNSTVRPHSSTFPIRWKIDETWICKNGEKIQCESPQKFAPNMEKIIETIEYDSSSGKTHGGIVGFHEQGEWETAIFEKEKTRAILQEFGRSLLARDTPSIVNRLNLNDWWMKLASGKVWDVLVYFTTDHLLGIAFICLIGILAVFILFQILDWIHSARLRVKLLRSHEMLTVRTFFMAILEPSTFSLIFRNLPDASKEKKENQKEDDDAPPALDNEILVAKKEIENLM